MVYNFVIVIQIISAIVNDYLPVLPSHITIH